MPLSGKQRRHLRALGHHLNPLVQIGKEGVSEGVARALDTALTDHELVKLKLNPDAADERDEAAAFLAETLKAEVAQLLGHTVLLYRRHPKEPKITFPKDKPGPASKASKGVPAKG